MEERFPIVTLGDGTWVRLDDRPSIMWMTEAEIEAMGDAPIDCEPTDHVHIEALARHSHWDDTCEAVRKRA